MKILLAVDGSKGSLAAVQCLIDHADWYRGKPEVMLVTVHLPVFPVPVEHVAVPPTLQVPVTVAPFTG